MPQSTIQSAPGPGAPYMAGPSRQPGGPPYQYGPGPQDNRYAPSAPGAPGAWQAPGAPAGWQAPGTPAPAHPFHLDLRRLSRVDQTVGGASLIVLISLFLPWFGLSGIDGGSISGTTAHGWLVLVGILAVVMVAYLVLRSGWDEFPLNLPIAHAPLLLIGTGLQLLLVFIGFVSVPYSLNWEIGAFLGLIASVVAADPLVVPAVRSWQGSR